MSLIFTMIFSCRLPGDETDVSRLALFKRRIREESGGAVRVIIPGFVLCLVFCLQGCLVFAASQMGYMEAMSKYEKLYDKYRLEQETINSDRAKQGLPPEPVEEYSAWLKQQPLRHNEIKVFKNHGVISSEEAREIKERETNTGQKH